ncbi:MAG TPA: DUF373 family protein [Thermoplasmatales archaeon]|nr:DUF373 family protein [Thermoplasmatales archaeon]
MKTLVLCIDRDNDFGKKAGIESPIIGREANLRAAQALALADPEDSDANCLFSAISTYDEIEDAEIVTVCGDVQVGTKSDIKISNQLDEIIDKIKPDKVILITDGAEDEYIIPIIESRIKIDALKRVVVKQSQTLEGTYYLIKRLMDDEKLQRRFMLPLAIILLIWGISAVLGKISLGFSFILIVLGAYLLIRVFHLEKAMMKIGREVVTGLKMGRMTLFSAILAIFIIIIAVVSAVNVLSNKELTSSEYSIKFVNEILWWFIASILLVALGRLIDAYFKEKKILWGYSILPFTLIAFGLILSASFNILIEIIHQSSFHSIFTQYVLSVPFLAKIIGGILIAFIGSVLYHIIEDVYGEGKK